MFESKIIAAAKFDATNAHGEDRKLEVEVFSPGKDPESHYGDHRCLVRIRGLGVEKYAYGVDSLQSLSLALKTIENELQRLSDNGWQFYMAGHRDHPFDIFGAYFLRQ